MKNNLLYTGFTSDLRRRISEHQKGGVRSTSRYLPVKLIHYESYILESDARRREKYLKTTEGKRLLHKQIRDILKQINYLGDVA